MATRFRLVSRPPVSGLGCNRLNVFIRFARQREWSLKMAKKMDRFLDSELGYTLDDYSPGYLESVGEPADLLDCLREQLTEYLAIAEREPFPTLRQIRQEEMRSLREERNVRWYRRLRATYQARERNIRLVMPVRKTHAAQVKVEKQWIGCDPEIQRIERAIARLRRADERVEHRWYVEKEMMRRGGVEQRPDEPMRLRRSTFHATVIRRRA